MKEEYFDLAFKEAEIAYKENEVPVGAVIVKDGKIISFAHNMKEKNNCCLYHAEIIAIKEASKVLNNWRLDDCDIYITLDPCPMCASAIRQARIRNVYSALNNSDNINTNILNDIFLTNSINPTVNFSTNLNEFRAKNLLASFFKKQRNL